MPFRVLEVAKIYSLMQVGTPYGDIMDTVTYNDELKINLNYLLNPFIFCINFFRRKKISYHDQYTKYVKKILRPGMPGGMADSLLEFHKEIKDYEQDKMEAQTKNAGNGKW